jgi:hypothetical protein
LGIIVSALALVIWLAGSNTGGEIAPASVADPAALAPARDAAPADPAVAPAATE